MRRWWLDQRASAGQEHLDPVYVVGYERKAGFDPTEDLDASGWLVPPSGRLLRLRDLVFDFPPAEAEERIEAWMSGAVTDPSIGWTAEELADHVRGEFSTYSWLLDVMLDRTGFDIAERSFRRSAYGTYTCKRRAP